MTGNDCENDRKRLKTTAGSPFSSATSRNGFLGNSPIFPAFSSIFRAYSAKKYPRCGKHRGVWLFFIVCCIFLWEYWWYFVEYKNYRQADHRCHTDSYCSIVMTIHC